MPDEKKTRSDYRLNIHEVEDIAHRSVERVSDDALLRVALEEEKRMAEIFRLSGIVAKRAGRKTVREDDVRIVYEILESEVR